MEDKKKYDFSVVDYQYTNVPQYRENQNEDWVTLGEDNLYPYFIQDLLTGSSMHNAIVRGCTDMIYGKGLDATDSYMVYGPNAYCRSKSRSFGLYPSR